LTKKPNHFEARLLFSSTMEGICSAQVQAQNEHMSLSVLNRLFCFSQNFDSAQVIRVLD
jgi:hypothetical protein